MARSCGIRIGPRRYEIVVLDVSATVETRRSPSLPVANAAPPRPPVLSFPEIVEFLMTKPIASSQASLRLTKGSLKLC